jgi:hypothetical protein
MKMPTHQRKWDDSSSPQWRFFQRNEKEKPKKNLTFPTNFDIIVGEE